MYPIIPLVNVNLENKMYKVVYVSSEKASSPTKLAPWLSYFCKKNNCKLIAVDGKAYIFEEKDPACGFVYLGFNVHQMLYFINKYCDSVKLEKVNDNWRLYLLSQEAGEYENEALQIKTCVKCHKDSGFMARGPLRRQNVLSIKFMVEKGHMPPIGFSMSENEKRELSLFIKGF